MSADLVLADRLTVDVAATLRADLLAAFDAGGGELRIDASQVERVDGAGLQLLLATRKEADARGRALRLVSASRELLQVLALTGLSACFDAALPFTGVKP